MLWSVIYIYSPGGASAGCLRKDFFLRTGTSFSSHVVMVWKITKLDKLQLQKVSCKLLPLRYISFKVI